jgi:hypothetical protein
VPHASDQLASSQKSLLREIRDRYAGDEVASKPNRALTGCIYQPLNVFFNFLYNSFGPGTRGDSLVLALCCVLFSVWHKSSRTFWSGIHPIRCGDSEDTSVEVQAIA